VILAEVLAKSGEAAKSGPIGLAVILLLCIVCYFLFKSMSKHLRTVRERFPRGQDDAAAPQPAERVALEKPAVDKPDSGSAAADESPGGQSPSTR
jgi:hypothetical protein